MSQFQNTSAFLAHTHSSHRLLPSSYDFAPTGADCASVQELGRLVVRWCHRASTMADDASLRRIEAHHRTVHLQSIDTISDDIAYEESSACHSALFSKRGR